MLFQPEIMEEKDTEQLGVQLKEQIQINGKLQNELGRLEKKLQDQNEM